MSRILITALLFLTPMLHAEDPLRENLRASVFDAAEAALKAANGANANVLAPERYRKAAAQYKKAQAAFDAGSDLNKVRSSLASATGLFVEAKSAAINVGEIVADAFQARGDALAADAKTRAPDIWKDAERQLYEAASRAEDGKTSRVNRYADKAEEKFRDAELSAIEVVLFTEIEQAIDVARRLDADDWAPESYTFAIDLLSQARTELSENRYDTDRPRTLATQSLHYARHAAYIAKLADDIDDNDDTLEAILMRWESDISRLGDLLNTPTYFDEGPTESINKLIEITEDRERQLAIARQELTISNSRSEILEEELANLQTDLEGQEMARERLNQRMQKQQEREDKIRRVENLFEPSEALVLRAQNEMIIRLIGLSFASGSAQIETRHYPLLAKLQEALAIFPQAPLTIEGHTDSHGVDAANLSLSNARADAVVSYLVANAGIQKSLLSAVGYGESNPIANNETYEGRSRNRRIDLVIYP